MCLEVVEGHLVLHDAVQQLFDLGIPSILVTHDFRDVRDLAADIAYLKDGKVEKSGSVDDFPGAKGDEFLNEFFAQP